MFTVRPLYPAVVVDETQPLHGHVSHMTPPEQDFACKGGRGERRRCKQKEGKQKGSVMMDGNAEVTTDMKEKHTLTHTSPRKQQI